ncbi:hypothetical protein [Gelidibacter salicanalis]|uniref:Uncharacterized protein n=1 Tax=Gelidibacter salicanalis TaxID=291193 RepID=A0A934KWT8_9FLAO|nr:hypothetical protein [Gelidibacter salicanalis]MBJ7881768.1 hypothetical protein [Gelidibacter salicanalis]
MKTLIILLLFAVATTVGQAQELTHLEEVKVEKAPAKLKYFKTNNQVVIKVDRAYILEFTKNPIGFMNDHFDIHRLIATLDNSRINEYEVTLSSQKGFMVANFDKKGNLLKTYQNFNDVLLPYDMRNQLYNSYKGWTMTKNKYKATTKGVILNKETYRVTLQFGNRKQHVKIDGNNVGTVVARN